MYIPLDNSQVSRFSKLDVWFEMYFHSFIIIYGSHAYPVLLFITNKTLWVHTESYM